VSEVKDSEACDMMITEMLTAFDSSSLTEDGGFHCLGFMAKIETGTRP